MHVIRTCEEILKYLGQWFSMRSHYPMHHSLGFLNHSTPYRIRSLQDWESMLLLTGFIEPVNSVLENVNTELCMIVHIYNQPPRRWRQKD